MKRLACALAIAGCACSLLSVPRDAEAARRRAASDAQLSILTPSPAEIGDRTSIDVSFRGGQVDTVELYLDNALVAKRQLGSAQSRGVLTFTLDTMVLAEGTHDVLVKAYGPDGKPIVSSAKLRIPAADLSAPVRIAYPLNGTLVSGLVPVRVALDQQILRARPYVTFFVDKDLVVLRNYPPYEYNWDTTRVANGWHLLEAWTQTDDAMGPMKARPVNVNVNNPGGETRRLSSIPDLRDKPANPIVMRPEAPRTAMGTSAPAVTGLPAGVRAASTGTGARLSQPSRTDYAATSAGASEPPIAAVKPNVGRPAARMSGGAVSQPSGKMLIARLPKSALPPLTPGDPLFAVVAPVRGVASTLMMAIRPGDTLDSVSKRSGVSAAELARLNNLKPGSKLQAGKTLVVPGAGSYDVAFDGQPVVFDVLPREKNGIRLAPFRQIFEHTGGKLYWFGTAQTVRAVNSSREVEIKIGQPRATVNNEAVLMEHLPFLDSGRTIVPLTFVRDALNVNVTFNAASGKLLIRSAR